jgi:hypothetical protein
MYPGKRTNPHHENLHTKMISQQPNRKKKKHEKGSASQKSSGIATGIKIATFGVKWEVYGSSNGPLLLK